MPKQHWWNNARGEWYVIIQLILLPAVFMLSAYYHSSSINIHTAPDSSGWGALICLVGLLIIIAGWISLGRSMSVLPKPREKSEFVRRGMYKLVRHPMYFGIIVGYFGWGMLWDSYVGYAGAVVVFVFFDIKARREERWLESKFSEYAAYKKRVKKLIPFVY